ncbi:hypothetical protein D3C79_885700 [compost metagenome]
MTGRSGLGNLRHCLVLRSADALLETAGAAIKQPVEHLDLFRQQAICAMRLPEPGLGQYPVDVCQCLFEAAQQCGKEPGQPAGDIQVAFLAALQDLVIAGPVLEDAGGHGIEANGLALSLGQRQIGNRPGQPTIAIIERVQRDKPEVRNTGA